MQHVAPFAAPRESVYAVLASSARRLTYGELSVIAGASGLIALAAAAFGRASWMLLAACYIAWCFAGWGILFHSPSIPRTATWRALNLTIAVSATGVFVALAFGVFFWALGPRWIL
jgi:hypothetical protein